MTYHSNENKDCYFPPLLSNGDIAFAPDAEGMLGYTKAELEARKLTAFDGIVVRARRRSAMCRSLAARLFPMGKFTFDMGSPLAEWSQSLRVEAGCFESDCLYEAGTRVASTGFIHPAKNLYVLQKRFHTTASSKTASYHLRLCGYHPTIAKYMEVLYTEKHNGICRIGFKMYGMEVFTGEIRAFVDKDYTAVPTEDGIMITFDVSDGEYVTLYYYLEDNLDNVNFAQQLDLCERYITDKGFAGLYEECANHYKDFFSLGYVRTSDETLNNIYRTSLYSIKCNTTKHSIAVGLNNGAWDGKYFAFDEYTAFLALLGANRTALAKRVPTYRLKSCLPSAIKRGSDLHRTPQTEDVARFQWQTGEIGSMELSLHGNWQDHVFQIPLVGIGAFAYYEYTGDEAFLRECAPMIRACAKFITRHMVYCNGDKLYIGKCTDLERLGAAVENPFMTACGAIKLLQCYEKTASILGIDAEYAEECATVAKKLYENLPAEDDKFVPYLGCDQKSIAVFSGKFPFDVVDSADKRLLRAWEDFEENGAAYGNMYPGGTGISSWYACWKANGYAKTKLPDKAYHSLTQAYTSAGVFNELFEINENGLHLRPWFSTAAGNFVTAVNEMLLQCNETTVTILPGMPHDVDVSFRLAARNGVVAEAEVKGGRLIKAILKKGDIDVTDEFKIEF